MGADSRMVRIRYQSRTIKADPKKCRYTESVPSYWSRQIACRDSECSWCWVQFVTSLVGCKYMYTPLKFLPFAIARISHLISGFLKYILYYRNVSSVYLSPQSLYRVRKYEVGRGPRNRLRRVRGPIFGQNHRHIIRQRDLSVSWHPLCRYPWTIQALSTSTILERR